MPKTNSTLYKKNLNYSTSRIFIYTRYLYNERWAYLLVVQFLQLEWFNDVCDKLWVNVRVTDLSVK